MHPPIDHVVAFQGVSKTYGRSVVALSNVSFHVKRRSIHALLGHNGAGKTTSIRLMLGLLKPDRGVVRVFGVQPYIAPHVRLDIGYVGEYTGLYRGLTVHDNLMRFCLVKLGDHRLCVKEVDSIASLFELEDVLKRKPEALSAGNRKRVAVARAFIGKPKLLLLDEPFNSLDPVWRSRLKHILRRYVEEHAATVVFSSHNLGDVQELADAVTILRRGRVVYDGPLEDLMRRYGALKLTLRVDNAHLLADELSRRGFNVVDVRGDTLIVAVKTDDDVENILRIAYEHNIRVKYVNVEKVKLEDIYVRLYSGPG